LNASLFCVHASSYIILPLYVFASSLYVVLPKKDVSKSESPEQDDTTAGWKLTSSGSSKFYMKMKNKVSDNAEASLTTLEE